jgi:hypothetical protein
MVRRWGQALASFVFGLGLAELLVRLLCLVTPLPVALAREAGVDSWRLAWLYRPRSLEAEGVDAMVAPDPNLGWRVREGTLSGAVDVGMQLPGGEVSARPTNGRWEAQIQASGAREPAPASTARTPGVRRVLVVGDSFGFGSDQGTDETWHAQLVRLVPNLEVVNLAVPGFSLDQMLLQHRLQAPLWKPDVVLIAHDHPIVSRAGLEFSIYIRPTWDAATDTFAPSPVPTPEETEAALSRRSHLGMLLNMARWTWWREAVAPAEYRRSIDRSQVVLDRLVSDAAAGGATPLVAWFPPAHEVEDPALFRSSELPQCASDPSVGCVDLLPALKVVADRGEPIAQGTHWSAPAAAAAAAALAEAITPLLP